MSELLKRLRERQLAKWLLGYAAGAWVLLQVLGLLASTYGWPPSAMRIAVAVAVLGFFVALLLAWYHGERGVQRATRGEAVLLVLIVCIGGAAIWHSERGYSAAQQVIATGMRGLKTAADGAAVEETP